MCELVVARANAGAPGRRIVRGTVLCAEDPIVTRAPRLFNRYEVQHYCSAAVEQATAAPGELRNVQPVPEFRCDECGTPAKSAAGLAAHKRTHRGA